MGNDLDGELAAELAALRRRAYGVGADIQDDPAAVARLHELEELKRLNDMAPPPLPLTPIEELFAQAGAADGPVSPFAPQPNRRPAVQAQPAPNGQPAAQPVVPPTPHPNPQPAPTPQPTPRPQSRLTRLLARPTGRVAAAAAVALVTAAITVPVTLATAGTSATEEQPIAVLHLVDDPIAQNEGFDFAPTTTRSFDEFHGMRVIVGRYPDPELTCLQIVYDSSAQSTGWGMGGCAPDGLDPVADVHIRAVGLSYDHLVGLEGATALRFVYVGDEVLVYAAASS